MGWQSRARTSLIAILLVSATTTAFAASPSDSAALVSRGLDLLRSNHNAEAAVELKHAIQLAPSFAEAHHNYGLALAKLGDTSAAIAELKQATVLKPELCESWLTLAGLQQSAGHVGEAIDTYNQYLERSAARLDLSDTRAKVRRLIDTLQTEFRKVDSAKNQAEQLKGTAVSALVQPAAQIAGTDDYLDESTHNGIFTWAHAGMPIKVCIHDSAAQGYKPQWKDILVRSFEDWSAASKGRVTFKFAGPNDQKDLDCWFVGQSADIDNLAEAGQAAMIIGANNNLQKGTIKLLTRSMSPVLPLTDNRMRTVCLHEIGHALGLAGHTTNPEDIMFYSTSFKDEWRNLSGRDARTIQRLYASN